MSSLTPKTYKKTYYMANVKKKKFIWGHLVIIIVTQVMIIEIKDDCGHILLILKVLVLKNWWCDKKNSKISQIS